MCESYVRVHYDYNVWTKDLGAGFLENKDIHW